MSDYWPVHSTTINLRHCTEFKPIEFTRNRAAFAFHERPVITRFRENGMSNIHNAQGFQRIDRCELTLTSHQPTVDSLHNSLVWRQTTEFLTGSSGSTLSSNCGYFLIAITIDYRLSVFNNVLFTFISENMLAMLLFGRRSSISNPQFTSPPTS